jgi:hypothetical protein
MKSRLFLAAAAAALAASGAAQAAEVVIKNAVARVVVVPEAGRSEVKVSVNYGSADLPKLQVSKGVRGETIIDGGLDRRVRGCSAMGVVLDDVVSPTSPPDNLKAEIRDHAPVRIADAPLITVYTPVDVDVKAGGAVFGAIGRAKSVELGDGGCGDWTVANVEGPMLIAVGGSGDVKTGTAGATRIRIGGSGDVSTGAVSGLDVAIGGSGDVKVRRVDGPVEVTIGGSGDVRIDGGRAARFKATVAGSGNVSFDGEAETVHATVAGSGDVRVKKASGAVNKTVLGSGSVTVNQ